MSKDILFVSTNLYRSFPSRKQKFAHFLEEKGFRILFIEPPYTYLALFKKGFNKNTSKGLEKISDNFFILNSFAWLPFFKKYKLFNYIDNLILLSKIKKACSILNFTPTILWTYMPFLPETIKKLHIKTIYDCVDDHASFPGLIDPRFSNSLEETTVHLSSYVIVTGNIVLKEKIKSFGKEPIVISNGVDWKLFAGGLFLRKRIDIKKQIVYAGVIAEWFDKEIVKKIAESFKDFKIILIGPQQIDTSDLKKYPNIILLGKMPQHEIAPVLRESAVGIIPFKINKLTEKIDPLKVYEYLASGLPVISTPVGILKDLPVKIGENEESFISNIKEEISQDSLEKRKERSEFAKAFSWENKYREIERILQELKK